MSSSVDPTSLSFTGLLAYIFALGSASSSSSGSGDELVRLVSLAAARSSALSLVSDNDELRDLTTSSLRALFVDSLAGVAHSQSGPGPGVPTPEADRYALRKVALEKSATHYRSFLATLVRMRLLSPSLMTLITSQSGPITESHTAVASTSSPAPLDAAARRAFKINLFKTERSLAGSLDTYRLAAREKKRLRAEEAPYEAFWDPLILRGGGARNDTQQDGEDGGDDDDEEEDEDDVADSAPDPTNAAVPTSTRSYLLLLLCLHALRASASLESATQELALLASMPPPEELAREAAERDARARTRGGASAGAEDDGRGERSWRLDGGGLPTSGPLLDPKGKPLRPFTITGADGKGAAGPAAELSDRERLQSEVFRPGHRLPTMSIDEYLEEEQRRGNIIQGGGAASQEKPTTAEARALRAEQDGTLDGEAAADEATAEARRWDTFSEENKKGAGNTMNRG